MKQTSYDTASEIVADGGTWNPDYACYDFPDGRSGRFEGEPPTWCWLLPEEPGDRREEGR